MNTRDLVLRVEDDPDPEEIAAVDQALSASTIAAAGQGEPKQLAVFVRRNGTVVGGVHGWTWGRCCELVSLWVDEPARRRGLGRALLTAAEEEARARRCDQVVLLSHGIQAPRLYASSGYQLVGKVEGYPAGSAAYWFRKRLDRPRTTAVTRTVQVAVAALVLGEIIDGLRTLSRRSARLLAAWWADVENRERTQDRRSEIVWVASLIARRIERWA